MIYLLHISWLFIAQAIEANDCFGGLFEFNALNECVFNCHFSGDKFITKDEVTWDQILNSCINVRINSQLSDCSELSDLVWGDGCSCPYCSCTEKDVAGSPVLFEQKMVKTCYNCTCNTHNTHPKDAKYYLHNEGNILNCNLIDGVDEGYKWNDFLCPLQYCLDENYSRKYINDGWFSDVVHGADCEKYCYCGAQAAVTCVTGFSNIFESDNHDLVSSFNRICQYNMIDCLNEPDRLFTIDTAPGCSDCPICDCGTHVAGENWWIEYESEDSPGQTQCVRCECIDTGNTTADYAYASCGYWDLYSDNNNKRVGVEYVKGTSECPPSDSYKCHQGTRRDIYDFTGDPDSRSIAPGPLNSETCYGVNLPTTWCSWSVEHKEWDLAHLSLHPHNPPSWGCEDSPYCAAYGSNDECIYADTKVSVTDCYGRNIIITSKNYLYCCNTDDCNHKDIDVSNVSTCTENKEYSTIMSNLYQCSYDLFYGDDDYCSANNYKEEINTTCSSVKAFYKKQAQCSCKMFANLYEEATSEWKQWMDKQVNGFYSGVGIEWNEPLNCNIDVQCKLSSGRVYIAGEEMDIAGEKIYFIAEIFIAIVVMIIN